MNEDIRDAIDIAKGLWLTVRSNPYFCAAEGGAIGAIAKSIDDAIATGHLDLSTAGLHKLALTALIGGYTAIRLLKRPTPETGDK